MVCSWVCFELVGAGRGAATAGDVQVISAEASGAPAVPALQAQGIISDHDIVAEANGDLSLPALQAAHQRLLRRARRP